VSGPITVGITPPMFLNGMPPNPLVADACAARLGAFFREAQYRRSVVLRRQSSLMAFH
jgi:hypothetical protein